jgi:hypothetical protein
VATVANLESTTPLAERRCGNVKKDIVRSSQSGGIALHLRSTSYVFCGFVSLFRETSKIFKIKQSLRRKKFKIEQMSEASCVMVLKMLLLDFETKISSHSVSFFREERWKFFVLCD